MATTARTDEQILAAVDAGHEMAGMVVSDATRAAAQRVLHGETTPEQEAAAVLAEIRSRKDQGSSGSDLGSTRLYGDHRHRIILRPEQILLELDADPTWSAYDQADRELAEREERLERAAGSVDATPGTDRGDAVRVLRQRLEVQQVAELAEYGARLADAVRGALAPGFAMDVVVELDTDLDTWGPVVIPLAGLGGDVGALATGVATAIAATTTPRDLPGTPLDRLAAQQP